MRRHVAEVHEGRKNHMCNTCGKCFARYTFNYTGDPQQSELKYRAFDDQTPSNTEWINDKLLNGSEFGMVGLHVHIHV